MANRTGDTIYTKQEILRLNKKKVGCHGFCGVSKAEEDAGFRSHDTNDDDRERERED